MTWVLDSPYLLRQIHSQPFLSCSVPLEGDICGLNQWDLASRKHQKVTEGRRVRLEYYPPGSLPARLPQTGCWLCLMTKGYSSCKAFSLQWFLSLLPPRLLSPLPTCTQSLLALLGLGVVSNCTFLILTVGLLNYSLWFSCFPCPYLCCRCF